MLKTCNRCKTRKNITDFYRCATTKDGYQGHCKKCSHITGQESVQNKRQSVTGKRQLTEYYIKSCWGITMDDYDWLLSLQAGRCALCGSPPTIKRMDVDHWHGHHSSHLKGCKEGIRGLLCNLCNRHFLGVAERYASLQSPLVVEYLSRRPFLRSESPQPPSLLLDQTPNRCFETDAFADTTDNFQTSEISSLMPLIKSPIQVCPSPLLNA